MSRGAGSSVVARETSNARARRTLAHRHGIAHPESSAMLEVVARRGATIPFDAGHLTASTVIDDVTHADGLLPPA